MVARTRDVSLHIMLRRHVAWWCKLLSESMIVVDGLWNIGNGSDSQIIGRRENQGYSTWGKHTDLFSLYLVDPLIECSTRCIRVDGQANKLMRRRNLPARGTVEQEPACVVQIWPPNWIVPLQIAQVQVSAKLLDVPGMDLKAAVVVQPKDSSVFVCA